MAYAYLVIYEGQPEDPDAFVRYYLDHHVPLLHRLPRIRGVEIERARPTRDAGADAGEVFMIARLLYDSLADLEAAMSSPQRELARRDMADFPPFHGRVHRRTVEIIPTKDPSA
ncbi:MAG: EthD family reductase [Phycisphaeraceae bacterium]|nr:EthD family reductase [Phycisphaeraceae bacterium]